MDRSTIKGYPDIRVDAEGRVNLTDLWKAADGKATHPRSFKKYMRRKGQLWMMDWKGFGGKNGGSYVRRSFVDDYLAYAKISEKHPESEPRQQPGPKPFDADAAWAEAKAQAEQRAQERRSKEQAEEAARKQSEPEPESTYRSGENWEYAGESWKEEYDPDTTGEEWKGEPEPDEPAYVPAGAHVNPDHEFKGPDYLFMDFEDGYDFQIRQSMN